MADPWTEDYNVNELGLFLGSTSSKSTSYDGLTDEEAELLKAELDEREARRVPLGFVATRRGRSGGRRAGSWPRVPRFDRGWSG